MMVSKKILTPIKKDKIRENPEIFIICKFIYLHFLLNYLYEIIIDKTIYYIFTLKND